MVMTALPGNLGRKVDDGQSVRVTAPAALIVEQGDFALIEGFHGFNLTAPKSQTTAAQDVILQTDGATYETTQVLTTDAFNTQGALVYFDPAAAWTDGLGRARTGLLTTTAGALRAVGRVVLPKDANGVIWMRLLPQVGLP